MSNHVNGLLKDCSDQMWKIWLLFWFNRTSEVYMFLTVNSLIHYIISWKDIHMWSIHKSDESLVNLLYLALCWQSHNYISMRHLILAIDVWIVHWKCIVCYFFASSKWMDMNPWSRDTTVVGLVYILKSNIWSTNTFVYVFKVIR